MKRTVHQVDLPSSTFAGSVDLAAWARSLLRDAGLDAGEVVDEDWGALVSVDGPGRVAVCCTVHAGDGGDDGAATITVEDIPRRLRAADPGAAALVASAVAALAAALPPDATWTQGGPPA